MSSDLWRNFAEPDDLSENPWAQPTITGLDHTNETLPQDDWSIDAANDDGHRSTTGWGHYSEILVNDIPTVSSTNFPAKPSEERRVLWSDSRPHQSADNPWEIPPTPVDSEIWRERNPRRSQGENAVEEDDFGDFEDPIAVPGVSEDNPKVTNISGKETAVRVFAHQRVFITNPPTAPQIEVLRKAAPNEQNAEFNHLSVGIPETTDEWPEWAEFSPVTVESNGKSTNNDNISTASNHPPKSLAHLQPHSEKWTTKAQDIKTSGPPNQLKPTNVPPPSILISLVATLVQKLPSQIEIVMQRPSISKTPQKSLEGALRGCILSLRVAARIISGRKMRWKRDRYLLQSMSIGPAQSKPGGMKLVGVDKAEARREDREALEFVRIWKQNLGRIRAALATVNNRIAGQPLALPDVSDSSTVQTVHVHDGGLTASECCFLCGLRRNERVAQVDSGVLDSFGEWWAKYWGHAECKTFWEEHEKYLRQR